MNPLFSEQGRNYKSMSKTDPGSITLFLSGDVMTSRGIDQVLPHSVDPILHERYVKNAKQYVQLAEKENGSIPEEVSYQYIWGEALDELNSYQPDIRIINLETAVTTSDASWKNKHIHYRMHPKNVALLTTANIDICVLGNNHVLDWEYDGLKETLNTLQQAGLKTAGAGLDAESASQPAVLSTDEGRILVFSYGALTAGIPMSWQADAEQPGVHFLPHIGGNSAKKVISDIQQYRQKGDRVIVSIHWGSNWGYGIPKRQKAFARRLIDSGKADLIHGHSSHHRKGIEVYKGKLILYGCGDLINDYEGISGHEKFHDDLTLLYFPKLDEDGELLSLRMSPMQIHRFQLRKAPPGEVKWLTGVMNDQCRQFGHSVSQTSDGQLELHWE